MNRSQHKRLKAALKRGFRKNQSARYPLVSSPLWKLNSIHLLARLMRVEVSRLRELGNSTEYNCFTDFSKPDKPREVQEPLGLTMRVHYRLVRLLDSIFRPEFLHSATRNRSNITNAKAHRGGDSVVATDIENFYRNTTYLHVKSFFRNDLGWPLDLAKIMALICTVDGHLPTGSCLSPLLSYFVHQRVFGVIELLCRDKNVALTLYVDDLTLSGQHASRHLLHQVKTLLKRRGLRTHKDTLTARGHPAKITGVVVDGSSMRVPNKHHLKIINSIDEVAGGNIGYINTLNGQLSYANAIDPSSVVPLNQRLNRKLQKFQRPAKQESQALN
jgi:hypothetical protein